MVKKEKLRVAVRFRPLNQMEEEFDATNGEVENLNIKFDELQGAVHCQMIPMNAPDMQVLRSSPQKKNNGSLATFSFSFDQVYAPSAVQSRVYADLARNPVEAITKGFNSTVFAYGQTGSGKTYSMFGPTLSSSKGKARGIVPRAMETIFQCVEKMTDAVEVTVTCSFLEIYQERIVDLLALVDKWGDTRQASGKSASTSNLMGGFDKGPKTLKLRESSIRGVYVQGLLERQVTSEQQVLNLVASADGYRSVAMTSMNERSTRAHTVLSIVLTQRLKNRKIRRGKLSLVDLAGSEITAKSEVVGDTMKETKVINRSLSALGNVIYALSDRGRSHVPYRDSVLTFMLRESLGGNTKSALLITCSPHVLNFQETLSSLRFGQRAKKIENKPLINDVESIEQLKLLVQELKDTVRKRDARIAQLERVLSSEMKGKMLKPGDGLVGADSLLEDEEEEAEEAAKEEEDIDVPFDVPKEAAGGASSSDPTEREAILQNQLDKANRKLAAMFRKRAHEREMHRMVMKTASAVQILQEGDVFRKYPFSQNAFSRSSMKRVVYDTRTNLLFYGEPPKSNDLPFFDLAKAKCINIADITHVEVGSRAPAFALDPENPPRPEQCFSIFFSGKGTVDRSLDLEADNRETRDLWVASLRHIITDAKRAPYEWLVPSASHTAFLYQALVDDGGKLREFGAKTADEDEVGAGDGDEEHKYGQMPSSPRVGHLLDAYGGDAVHDEELFDYEYDPEMESHHERDQRRTDTAGHQSQTLGHIALMTGGTQGRTDDVSMQNNMGSTWAGDRRYSTGSQSQHSGLMRPDGQLLYNGLNKTDSNISASDVAQYAKRPAPPQGSPAPSPYGSRRGSLDKNERRMSVQSGISSSSAHNLAQRTVVEEEDEDDKLDAAVEDALTQRIDSIASLQEWVEKHTEPDNFKVVRRRSGSQSPRRRGSGNSNMGPGMKFRSQSAGPGLRRSRSRSRNRGKAKATKAKRAKSSGYGQLTSQGRSASAHFASVKFGAGTKKVKKKVVSKTKKTQGKKKKTGKKGRGKSPAAAGSKQATKKLPAALARSASYEQMQQRLFDQTKPVKEEHKTQKPVREESSSDASGPVHVLFDIKSPESTPTSQGQGQFNADRSKARKQLRRKATPFKLNYGQQREDDLREYEREYEKEIGLQRRSSDDADQIEEEEEEEQDEQEATEEETEDSNGEDVISSSPELEDSEAGGGGDAAEEYVSY